jgi:hypothetical protein
LPVKTATFILQAMRLLRLLHEWQKKLLFRCTAQFIPIAVKAQMVNFYYCSL